MISNVDFQPKRGALRGLRVLWTGSLLIAIGASAAWGQAVVDPASAVQNDADESDVVHLPRFVLEEARVANDLPAATYSAPVSVLRFEPRVDVQTRNFAEAQGDVTIRGGIFEGTALQVAGLTIYDPQTGHYATELPIAPEMLSAPQILTGLDHALSSMQATAGTIGYRWREIRTGGSIHAGWGSGDLLRGSLRAAQVLREGDGHGGLRVASEVEVSASQADGTLLNGDHEFFRVSGRTQVDSTLGRTTFFGGYQSKFFGWPNLYTPFGVAETEDIQTTLLMVSHRHESDGVSWETAAHYRRNQDDYEFNRTQPGIFNPYQHTTQVGGGFVRMTAPVADWRIDARAEFSADEIESTSLGQHGRSYWKLGAMAARDWNTGAGPGGDGTWSTRFGLTFDDTNRDASAASPLAEIAWSSGAIADRASVRWYAQYSESTRVPNYTALYSSPTGGLFRGNRNLGREDSHNLETGVQLRGGAWSLHTAVFQRRDDPLVDWTYSFAAENARTARAVEIDNTGVEIVASYSWRHVDLIAGYTWLKKNADYGNAAIDASFYALNFPHHRFTLAAVARLGAGFELRSDNEFRVQEPNALRRIGGDSALLSSLGLFWRAPQLEGLELSLVIDNLWRSDFQELPAVPAPGRQVTLGAGWRW